MQKKINREDVLSGIDIYDVISRYVELKRDGIHWKGCCPFHDEKTPSFTVTPSKGIYKCFGCGAAGDAVSFVMDHLDKTYPETAAFLKGDNTWQNSTAKSYISLEKTNTSWRHISPAPEFPDFSKVTHSRYGSPTAAWCYKDPNGLFIGAAVRFDGEFGKQVLPYIYATDGNSTRWMWKGMAGPRPLYNLHQFAQPKTIIMVEGEKAAEAAQQLFPKNIVTTWPGGANGIHMVDWTPLYGRTVVLSPDNDAPGFSAMIEIAEGLANMGCTVRWMPPPSGQPKGWDWADFDGTPDQAVAYAKANVTDVPPKGTVPIFAPKPEPEPEPAVYIPEGNDPTPENKVVPTTTADETEPFAFLGWDKSEGNKATYHFYSFDKKAILSSSSAGMNTNFLLELADLNYWEDNFRADKKGFNLQAAVNWLVRQSDAMGPFYPSIRGRGAWVDRGRVVIHNGPFLIVDGERTELQRFKSRHIYENTPDLGFTPGSPITAEQGRRLFDIVKMLNWERDVNSALLLGWCVLAPVCGALQWRPHIWLTGPSGSGKSWVFLHIVRRLLGGSQLAVQGDSTEAGLRQTLGHDAIPVVFDEAEQEDERAAGRIQNVLALMRTASADDGGLLVKGSAGGHAKSFKIRSCFAYASIVPQLKMQADRNRVTMLGLQFREGPEYKQKFERLVALHEELINDEFVVGLQTRTIQMLPTVLKNIATFRNVAATALNDARTGDQLGSLMAGAFSLVHDEPATVEQAMAWMQSSEWSEERGLEMTRDEHALLNHMLERTERVEMSYGGVTRTIGELIKIALGEPETGETVDGSLAASVLGRIGIRIIREDGKFGFAVANQHSRIKEMLARTPWANNHGKLLQRLRNAEALDKPVWFAATKSRAVYIPFDLLKQ